MRAPEDDAAHWRRTRNLAVFVLALAALAGLGVFWAVLASGGADCWYAARAVPVFFVLLAFYLNWRQDGIDRDYGEGE